MNLRQSSLKAAALVGAALALGATPVLAQENANTALVTYGTMHEAVGQQHHQGRVVLRTLADQPHFFGIAALEGLQGEITVFDSDVTITGVTDQGSLEPISGDDLQATLLAGAYVSAWTESTLEEDIAPAGFDAMVRDAATHSGIDVSKPFVFTMEGEFSDVRMHVINGACPLHARMNNIQLDEAQMPFEGEFATIQGRLVGIYASDAVGMLTHPGTSTHVHLIFRDEASGEMTTAHLERVGPAKGAVLKLPGQG